MKRLLITLIAMSGTLFALWLALGAALGGGASPLNAPASTAPISAATSAIRFVPVDVFLDTGATPLGCYQLEVVAKDATVVGLEGGDAPAFRAAPFYDPAALAAGNRLIVAAFSTDDVLPSGMIRVARLHVMVTGAGDGASNLTGKLITATDPQGRTVNATLQFRLAAISPTHGDKR